MKMASPQSSSAHFTRLVDYFAVIGFDDSKERNGASVGKVLQRFPLTDWHDVPFFPSLDLFVQPRGWFLSSQKSPPSFFVSVLTDIGADRHYAACLSFDEPRFPSESPVLLEDEEEEQEEGIIVPASPTNSVGKTPVLYCPKCLVLVSRHSFFETFRNCLGTIYTVYIERMSVELESLVGNLLSGIRVPPSGGPLQRFSLGAGDRQAVQPSSRASIPVTHTRVALLFQQLGIYNVICLFCAVLTDKKILFHSQSYSRLTDACHALSCLLYPFKYNYIYVPILPGSLLEVLHSPTPFIMGVHSSFRTQTVELVGSSVFDVICVDLDSGSVFIPEHIMVPPIPEPYNGHLSTSLTLVLNRDLYSADLAFTSVNGSAKSNNGSNLSSLPLIDKQIRACFVRLFAELLKDYRLCLKIVRIHPRPFITFHKAAFLGLRGFQEDEFMNRLLDSMSFQTFTAERGVPFRICDLFDETLASISQIVSEENGNLCVVSENINALALQLLSNESPSSQPFVIKVPKPSDAALRNPAPPAFPQLDPEKVQLAINSMQKKLDESVCSAVECQAPREVPVSNSEKALHTGALTGPNIRRVDVLKNCLRSIFDNKIADAKKMMPAVSLSMKSQAVRVMLCQELHRNLHPQNRATLEPQQFQLVINLMNYALQNESAADEHGVAYALLSLSSTYCRRLTPGVLEFAYTCIQGHPVWKNTQFWEAAFFHDVHIHLKQLYLPSNGGDKAVPYGRGTVSDMWNLHDEPSCLRIACEKLKVMDRLSEETVVRLSSEEEQIIYSQAVHYTNYMVNMTIPLDASKLNLVETEKLEQRSFVGSQSQVADSVVDEGSESESVAGSDVESGFVEGGGRDSPSNLGDGTVCLIRKFMDKVCCEAGLQTEKVKAVHQRIPGFVALHIENLQQIFKESKRLPPINKPKMLVPAANLPGENVLQGYLRVILLPDGRLDTVQKSKVRSLLPAEGAIFLTNYRIIFKGQPLDPYLCEQVVIRWMPVMSMTKNKRIGQQFLAGSEEQTALSLHDALQFRSATFQLFKLGFEDEVSPDKVESFCTSLEQQRWPENVAELFAVTGNSLAAAVPTGVAEKSKRHTLRDMAKHKILKTAKKAGLAKDHSSSHKGSKYVFPLKSNGSSKGNTLTASARKKPTSSDDESDDVRLEDGMYNETLTNAKAFGKTLERLTERDYCRDFQRLCLCSKVELSLYSGGTGGFVSPLHQISNSSNGFRLCTVNKMYNLCRSYPAVFIVPSKVSDESLKKVAKCHKHGRFPVVTWCSGSGALLLRGAGFHVRNVVSRLKKHTKETLGASSAGGAVIQSAKAGFSPGGSAASLAAIGSQLKSSSLEEEKYIASILLLSPNQANVGRMESSLTSSTGSLLSLDSLLLTNIETGSIISSISTPEPYRKPTSTISSAANLANILRGSGGKSSKTMYSIGGKLGSLRPAHQLKPGTTSGSALTMTTSGQKKRNSDISLPGSKDFSGPQTLARASLYIFGEKGQGKVLKLEKKCEFIPIDYPSSHAAKASLKKFLRVTAPSTLPADSSYSHLKVLEESGWLQMVKMLLQISTAVVDLIDIQNSSVAFCLEDGWDATAQMSSLVQILLDPYYRTFDGFKVLIAKEWLAFGHRFSHRCNHTLSSASSGFAPIFLVFLDAVHQICQQFPGAFEFNDFFLRFLAYHSSSGYFGTFLLDSEADRVETGLIHFENKPRPRSELTAFGPDDPDTSRGGQKQSSFIRVSGLVPGGSIWDYIEEKRKRSPIFYNFLYAPGKYDVLRPHFCLAALDLWQFYCEDYLSYGSTYDLDAAEAELLERQTEGKSFQGLNGFQSERRVVDLSYDSVAYSQPNVFQDLLEEICTLEKDLDLLPHLWSAVISNALDYSEDKADMSGSVSSEREWSRWLNRALHKKSTIEILLKGKTTSQQWHRWSQHEGGGGGNMPHNFVKDNFTAPEHCHVCNRILWGVVKQGLRCQNCEYSCHEKCASVATVSCKRTVRLSSTDSPAPSSPAVQFSNELKEETEFVLEGGERGSVSSIPSYPETRTHEGYLMKKGALLKAWKQRWFVLDSMKHQLRYYDYDYDSHCKGFIDLKDVIAINLVQEPAGMPKKNEGSFFDVRTNKRIYNFMANSALEAKDWVDKIHSCLQ